VILREDGGGTHGRKLAIDFAPFFDGRGQGKGA
jgi:hypothetical protein